MDFKEQIKQIIVDVSGLELSAIDDKKQIKELGLDSIDIAQIIFTVEEKLELKFDRQIPFETLGNYAIGEFLDTLLEQRGKQNEK